MRTYYINFYPDGTLARPDRPDVYVSTEQHRLAGTGGITLEVNVPDPDELTPNVKVVAP